MIAASDLIRHAVAEIERVRREGGTCRIVLPGSKPGTVTVGEIDQDHAECMIAWMSDKLIAELRGREQRGEPLSEMEAETLAAYRERVPHFFNWAARRGGPSVLRGLNARGEPLHYEVVLAAHPSGFDIPWEVPKSRRAPGFRGPVHSDSGGWWPMILIGALRFPPDADLLAAWTKFEQRNAEVTAQRLSHEGQRLH